ncbi:MAG: hypothetical protein IJU79_06230 [Desulfovibrionaceae bacterium]|nr:hypothetical protein [Desulfovibrionaceae bacterium]
MLNGISSNLSNVTPLDQYKIEDKEQEINVNQNINNHMVIDEMMDMEAQGALVAVGNDLSSDYSQARSIHSGLDYSRVMSLLEGL